MFQFNKNNRENMCNNTKNIVSKYDDADVSSKRRKQEFVEDEYKVFKQTAECCANSSFQDFSFHSLDFKGGPIPVNSKTDSSFSSATSPPLVSIDTSAKNDLTITTKPSQTSKGFENTFKLLQNHVENNIQKAANVLQVIKSESSSTSTNSLIVQSSDKETPNRLELELEAIRRMQTILQNVKPDVENNEEFKSCDPLQASTPLLRFLYDFVLKRNESMDEFYGKVFAAGNSKQADNNINENNSDISYHASKTTDGKNCLRIVRNILANKVLCGNRVSQMTRAYDDIEAVTRLLEEKEKDLELTVQIGKELLTQNNTLENRINELEADLKSSNDDRAQLVHELHKKNELIAVLTNDGDDVSEADTPTLSKSITFDLLQKKVASLQDENKSLKIEASQLARETDAIEEHERRLMEDITLQLSDANSQFDNLSLELERQREENRLQHEQIVSLTARLAEAEMRLHQLTHDNDEHITLLNITKENQNLLALELVEFKQRYQEVLALLQEAQDQLRKQRKKTMPQARSSFVSGMGLLQPESLHSELMESSMYSENSLDSGISGDSQRINDRIGRLMSQVPGNYGSGVMGASSSIYTTLGAGGLNPPYKRVFETVRCASKNSNYADSGHVSMTQLGVMSMSSSSGPRMSSMPYGSHPAGSFYRSSTDYEGKTLGVRTLSCESLNSQSDDGYPAQPSGVPGAPGAKDLEAALKRLTPAEVLARRAMLSYAPVGTYTYDEQPTVVLPLGIRTPDSIMSTGSSGISSSTNMSGSMHQWRLPEKLQIVKPIEGSQTLHHWSRLATPTLSGLLEERPGVTIRGGRGLDDLGMQVYNLSDVEEDVSDDLPGKQFEAAGCTYTYTTSVVMHPDDGIVNDLSFLSQSQMSSRMASASTSRQPSCPVTPRAGLSRKNSCSTFSVNLGLASMLNERGIKAVTPSALNTPAGPNFSPTVTPCNSPEGSPARAMSPEPLFGLLSSGADLIRRKLVGGDIERPNRNQQKQQKIMLSRLERRALRSLKLVEKVESIGLENIIATQPSAVSQLASGIANRSASPMSQLISLKNIHTNSNKVVDDIHFNRDQIKDVLHKGLTSPTPSVLSSLGSSACNSDSDESIIFHEVHKKLTETATTSAKAYVELNKVTAQNNNVISSSSTDTRVKQMQRQKSRRTLKNGIAAQRSDLGAIGNGRVRTDLGKVATIKNEQGNQPVLSVPKGDNGAANGITDSKLAASSNAPRESQSITQAFVGTVSSLLFGRKGGWL